MNRRLLIAEPDKAGRTMMDRVLTSAGYTAEDFESAQHARILLDDGAYDLAVVDEFAGTGGLLDDVRFLRGRYPRLPVVVTGTLLSPRVLLELLRLGVGEAVAKPFTPGDLRDAVGRVLSRAGTGHTEALEYAAAVESARVDLAAGRTEGASRALARAWAVAPLDAEVMAMEALRAELEGRDTDADRGYRAALALRCDDDDGPDPRDGLARLAMYNGAKPVTVLPEVFATAPVTVAAEPVREQDEGARSAAEPRVEPRVTVTALGIAAGDGGQAHVRVAGDRAYVVLAGDLRPEHVRVALGRVGAHGPKGR